ncbi:MAG: hypothetical protein Q9157_002908 [Trypethelium eluteriae]
MSSTSCKSSAGTTSSPTATPTINTSNSGSSLFTDLSPLLTLFGDEVTKQFLSTSMGWADCLLISTAPLGIVTIIVSAIRISGHPLLKAVIGRAHDSPADEEKDILSSTSREVREVWDGNRVIRQAGASQATEIVYSTEREMIPGSEYALDGPVWTRSLVSAVYGDPSFPRWREQQPPCEVCDYKFRQSFGQRRGTFDSEDSLAVSKARGSGGDVAEKAPNLIMNVPKAIPTRSSIWIWAFIGLLVQSVVFIVNGLGVYYYHWPRSTYKAAPYAFPVWAVGTISITIGVCICAKVIEINTDEHTIRPTETVEDGQSAPRPKFHVVRLQKAIDAMKLPSFAIYNAFDDPEVHISQRGIFPSGRAENSRGYQTLAAWTVIGSFFALSGFILQNIGIRELHWSAAVAQLVATLILALIRAWIRRHVSDAPVVTKKLCAGFEAAELACDLYHADYLMIYGGNIRFHSFLRPLEEVSVSVADDPPPKDKALKSHGIKEPHLLDKSVDAGMDISLHKIGLTAVQRVFQSQSVLVEVQPDMFKTKEVAEHIYDAAVEILKLLSITSIPWNQRVFFKGSAEFAPRLKLENGKLKGLVEVPLVITDDELHREPFCRSVQSLMNLTMYHFSMLEVFSAGSLFRVLASCPIGEEYSRKWQKKKEILGQGYEDSLETWIRTPDGRIDQETVFNDAPRSLSSRIWKSRLNKLMSIINTVILGMSFSALKFNYHGKPYVEKGKAVEVGLYEWCRNDEEAIRAVRGEFVMNFLDQLVYKGGETLRRQLGSSTTSISNSTDKWRPDKRHFENILFDSIADVLVKHKLEDNKVEATRLIAAAFLSSNLIPPIPEGFLPADSTEPHNPDEPGPGPMPPLPPREVTHHENSPAVRRRAPNGEEGAQTPREIEATLSDQG